MLGLGGFVKNEKSGFSWEVGLTDFCIVRILTEKCFQTYYRNLHFNSNNSTQYIQTSHQKNPLWKWKNLRLWIKIHMKIFLAKISLLKVSELFKFKPLKRQSWTSPTFCVVETNHAQAYLGDISNHGSPFISPKLLKFKAVDFWNVLHG